MNIFENAPPRRADAALHLDGSFAPDPVPGTRDHHIWLEELAGNLSREQSVPQILEQFAQWLGRHVPVKLVAFGNPNHAKNYLVCHGEPANSSTLLPVAWEVLQGPLPRVRHWRWQDWYFHLWLGLPLERWDRLLIIESGEGLAPDEANLLMRESLEVLHLPLRNALRRGNWPG